MSQPRIPESVHSAAAYNLCSVIKQYAPDDTAQLLVNRIYDQAYADNQGESAAVVKALAGILLDGLNHGNWPWVLKQVNFTGDREADEQIVVNHLLQAARLARGGSATAAQEVRDDTATLITNYGWQRSSVESYIDRFVNWPAQDEERRNGSRYSRRA